MTDVPRQKLVELVDRFGLDLCADPKRCEGLLRDVCGEYRREIFVLVSAVREGIGNELRQSETTVPKDHVLARLTRQLHDNLGLTETLARWAVESWALALGFAVPDGFRFQFKCPGCHATGTIQSRLAGQKVDCPQCKAVLEDFLPISSVQAASSQPSVLEPVQISEILRSPEAFNGQELAIEGVCSYSDSDVRDPYLYLQQKFNSFDDRFSEEYNDDEFPVCCSNLPKEQLAMILRESEAVGRSVSVEGRLECSKGGEPTLIASQVVIEGMQPSFPTPLEDGSTLIREILIDPETFRDQELTIKGIYKSYEYETRDEYEASPGFHLDEDGYYTWVDCSKLLKEQVAMILRMNEAEGRNVTVEGRLVECKGDELEIIASEVVIEGMQPSFPTPLEDGSTLIREILIDPKIFFNRKLIIKGVLDSLIGLRILLDSIAGSVSDCYSWTFSVRQRWYHIDVSCSKLPKEERAMILQASKATEQDVTVEGRLIEGEGGRLELVASHVAIEGMQPSLPTSPGDGSTLLEEILLDPKALRNQDLIVNGVYEECHGDNSRFYMQQGDHYIWVHCSNLPKAQRAMISQASEAKGRNVTVEGRLVECERDRLKFVASQVAIEGMQSVLFTSPEDENTSLEKILLYPKAFDGQERTIKGIYESLDTEKSCFRTQQGDHWIDVYYSELPKKQRAMILRQRKANGRNVTVEGRLVECEEGRLKLVASQVAIEGMQPSLPTSPEDGSTLLEEILLNPKAFDGQKRTIKGNYRLRDLFMLTKFRLFPPPRGDLSFCVEQGGHDIDVYCWELPKEQRAMILRQREANGRDITVEGRVESETGRLKLIASWVTIEGMYPSLPESPEDGSTSLGEILVDPQAYHGQKLTIKGFCRNRYERGSCFYVQRDNYGIWVRCSKLPEAQRAMILSVERGEERFVTVEGRLKREGDWLWFIASQIAIEGMPRPLPTPLGDRSAFLEGFLLDPQACHDQEMIIQGVYKSFDASDSSFYMQQGNHWIDVDCSDLPEAQRAIVSRESEAEGRDVAVKGRLMCKGERGCLGLLASQVVIEGMPPFLPTLPGDGSALLEGILLYPQVCHGQKLTIKGVYQALDTKESRFRIQQLNHWIDVDYAELPKEERAMILRESEAEGRIVAVEGRLVEYEGDRLKLIASQVTIEGTQPSLPTSPGDGSTLLEEILLDPQAFHNQNLTVQGVYQSYESGSTSFFMKQGDHHIRVYCSKLPGVQRRMVSLYPLLFRSRYPEGHIVTVEGQLKIKEGELELVASQVAIEGMQSEVNRS